MERLLILEDGSVYRGTAFGSDNFQIGELVFNTSMTGYQEILTDNSYCGQIVMMTYPLIGNYGINRDDNESMIPCVFGFVVKDYCEYPSNFRCSETLDDFLKRENIPGIYDIDTREITMKIRNVGTMKAVMADVDADVDAIVAGLKAADFLHDQVARVSTNKVFPIPNRGKKVVLMDFGAKLGIVRELSKRGCDLVIVPYDTPASTILSYRPDGVMLSNGPGDPTDVKVAIETIKELIPQTVVFGICLGHQLISLACGAKTYKLKFGHRGANHPVVNLSTGKVEITGTVNTNKAGAYRVYYRVTDNAGNRSETSAKINVSAAPVVQVKTNNKNNKSNKGVSYNFGGLGGGAAQGGIVGTARSRLGCAYRMGASGPTVFDCSGFTSWVYSQNGKSLPRTAAAQYSGTSRVSKDGLTAGDLVFFAGTYKSGISHVGIYIGGGQFIHAANSKTGVVVSSLNSGYYSAHYAGAGRR